MNYYYVYYKIAYVTLTPAHTHTHLAFMQTPTQVSFISNILPCWILDFFLGLLTVAEVNDTSSTKGSWNATLHGCNTVSSFESKVHTTFEDRRSSLFIELSIFVPGGRSDNSDESNTSFGRDWILRW